MPKKPPPNAFYYYMKEVQEKMKLNGQRVPNMKEMPGLVSPAWNRMTADEKKPYEDMVRAYRQKRANTDDGRFTSDGIPIQLLRQQEAEAEENVKAVEAAVRTLLETFHSSEEIAQSSVFIMSFNILVGTLEDLYLPNEIGIVEYSINDGIKNEYHRFIDPGPIPIGYTSEAKSYSETCHEIPISGFALATSDYGKLYRDIRRFLGVQSHAEKRYIFCHPNDLNQFQKCLDWLKDHSGLNSKEEIIFANLGILVAEMKAAVNEPYAFKSSVIDSITSNAFDYSPNILCNFHDQKDNKNCALGYCKRLAYVLSDILCKPFGVELTNKHFPERTTQVEGVIWEPKRDIRPVLNKADVTIKPVIPHIPTTIVRSVRSKFDDADSCEITPSALSETSSVVSESVQLDDDMMFPSLGGKMSSMSIRPPSESTSVKSKPSWAQISSNNQPLRKPRSVPALMRDDIPLPGACAVNSNSVGLGRGAGIGRGRGNVLPNRNN